MPELIMRASYGAAVLLAFLAAVLFVVLLVTWVLRRRSRRMSFPKTRHPQDDTTNTMIMFQTMRDILEQQKDVARQLNVSLDNKVKYIKKIVETSYADLREMRETARRLAAEVSETKAELAALQAQVGHGARSSQQEDGAPSGETQGVSEPSPPLEALSRPVLDEPPDSGFDRWVGLDFGEVPEEEEEEPEPAAAPPENPEHAEAARNAFRALLNLDSASGGPKAASTDSEKDNGKGRTNSLPLKKRIYEYSDVGMTVSEIARELGLGKGEVRLILNLRKDRGE
ncbi:MAG: hypothetical protein R6V12_20315 [Candidatus Hydrogenedentota bacterium]